VGARLLVIGLDGATFDLVAPWAAAGELPALARLMAAGAWGPLRSTLPPATFPAWTSLVTGVNPGRHGVLDFVERVPGTFRVRFVNGSRRRTPALWTRLSAAGRRVAVLSVPATYPPEPVNGVMVSGFDSPVTTRVDGSFVFPRAFHAEMRRLVGRLPFADFQEVRTGPRWHDRALASLLDGVARRATLAEALLRREPWDALMVVFGESDTVAHHFWRFHDPASPRHAPSAHADAIRRVYRALDAAIARLVAAAGDACVAVVSDHGSGGASDRVVHLNRYLAQRGFLGFRPRGGAASRALRGLALRAVPFRLQGTLVRRAPEAAGRLEGGARFGGIDWARTRAYSEELDYHPSVWINAAGREPEGTVRTGDYTRTRDAVAGALRAWRDDEGRAVVERVWRREELYHGPATALAPDLLLELATPGGYGPSCLRSVGPGRALRRLAPAEHGAGKGSGLNGAHRRDGMFLFAGPGVRPGGAVPAAAITDVLPTLLALTGLPLPLGLDGAPMARVVGQAARWEPDPLPETTRVPHPYGEGESREIAARLESLGYLERVP
jgi:predicted AlkP superfamily phosphohydrolase/phosphomutase